jgi:hypothetical protein
MTMVGAVGASAFGAVIGWYIYYINRHRREEVTATDLVTLIDIIDGTAVLTLLPAQSVLFGAYGVGLATGFFGYFLIMVIFVGISKSFGVEYFLDGRRSGRRAPTTSRPAKRPRPTYPHRWPCRRSRSRLGIRRSYPGSDDDRRRGDHATAAVGLPGMGGICSPSRARATVTGSTSQGAPRIAAAAATNSPRWSSRSRPARCARSLPTRRP